MKNNKKIVFISAYSSPELISSEYLGLDIMSQSSKAGFDVIYITPNQVRGIKRTDRKKYKKTRIVSEKKWTHRIIKCFSFAERNFVFRMIRYYSFGIKAVKYLKKENDIAGIFMWSYPPLGFAKKITKYAKRKNIAVLMDIHDIQPEILKTNPVVSGLIKRSTNYVLKNASYVFTLSEDMKNTLIKKNVIESKIHVIPPWKYTADSKAKVPDKIVKKTTGKYVVGYIGNIGSFQNIDLLLETAKLMIDHLEIVFLFVGNGAKANLVKEESFKNENILYFDKVDSSTAYQLYKFVNLNIISLNSGIINYACPSKTPMVLESSNNVLLIMNDSNYSRELVSDGAFIDSSFSPSSIKNTILNIKSSNKATNYSIKSYDREYCLNKWRDSFLDLYKEANKLDT